MTPLFRACGVLALTALCACAEERHPLDLHLAQLRPDTVSTLPALGWPSGTLLCPMTPYQSELRGSEPPADRVNAFLARKKFLGEEGRWSLMVVKPATDGDAGIEHLMFKNAKNFDIINDPEVLARNAEVVARARTHAGNLAHALKTPLSVLGQATALQRNDLERLVQEQLALARRHV